MARSLFTSLFAATAATAALATPAALSAQATGCEDAAVRISTNALPRVGAPQWNDWVTLTGCGTRGATIISGALRSDGVRTETELTRLDHVAGLLDGWYQPSLVSAYEWLLRSPDASNAVRLRAMWLLGGLYSPSVDVAGPLQGFMAGSCESYDRNTTLRDAPASMSANEYDQAREAIASAADDRNAPEYVRTTARCWEALVRDGARGDNRDGRDARTVTEVRNDDRPDVVVQQQTVYVERPVRVIYECDNRFVFYNDAGYDLAVRYDGYGNPGVLRVSHGGPYIWVAARFGPVRFWVGDQQVVYSNATYRPCGRTRVYYGASINVWHGWYSGLGIYISNRNRPRVVYPRGHRQVYVVPRAPRPIIVVRPRGADPRDNDRGRNDGGRNDRGRDDNGRNDGGRGNPRGGDPRRNIAADTPRRIEPINVPRRNEPVNVPRRNEGTNIPRSQPRNDAGSGGQPQRNLPAPRVANDQPQRVGVPKGGGGEGRAAPTRGAENRGGDNRGGEKPLRRGGQGR